MKVNIYGCEASALHFVLDNKDLEINKFIDGKHTEPRFFDLNYVDSAVKYPIVYLSNAEEDLRKYHTIICSSPESYWEIKKNLETLGLVEFEDFEYYKTYRKKMAICYGNCNAFGVKAMLESSPDFYHNYGFYPTSTLCDLSGNNGIKFQFSEEIMNRCDLFLYQMIRKENVYGPEYATLNILNTIHNDNCKLISIPNYNGLAKFMFPQCYKETVKHLLDVRGSVWPFVNQRDFYIDANYQKMNVNQLCAMITEKDVIEHSHILNLFEEFQDKLVDREKELSVKTSTFISSHFRDLQLFYDLSHPTEKLLSFIASKVMLLINKNYNYQVNRFYYGGGYSLLDLEEIPIYNSVRKTFNFQFSQPILRKSGRRYCVQQDVTWKPLTIKQYVEFYLRFNYRGF